MTNTLEYNQPTFLRLREVAHMIGLQPGAINRAVRAGQFPRPFLIGVRTKAFKRAEIEAWMRQRDADRASYADPACPNVEARA